MKKTFQYLPDSALPGGTQEAQSLLFLMNVYILNTMFGDYSPPGHIFNRPGEAGAVLQTALSLINSLTESWFVKISLRRRHAPTVENGAFSHKID